MRSRELITLLGGAAAWPVSARAQETERVRLVGLLMGVAADGSDAQASVATLQQGLQEAGWAVGRNIRIDARWSSGDVSRLRREASELVALSPGFIQFEYGLAGKWLDLLKEIAPQVSRVGVVRELEGGPVGIGQWAVIQAFASPMGVELSPINLRSGGETDRTVSAFVRGPNDGLIVVVGTQAAIQRQRIVALAARHRLPAVYFNRLFVEAGGLVSYAPNLADNYRRTAGYVDRILKGQKPGDLPVQAPTKYELVINLKTAKALDIAVPPSLLARADEVIE